MERTDKVVRALNAVFAHRDAILDGGAFSGSPLSPEDFCETAGTATKMFPLDRVNAEIKRGDAGSTELHMLLMIAWAGGFKAGLAYASDEEEDAG